MCVCVGRGEICTAECKKKYLNCLGEGYITTVFLSWPVVKIFFRKYNVCCIFFGIFLLLSYYSCFDHDDRL